MRRQLIMNAAPLCRECGGEYRQRSSKIGFHDELPFSACVHRCAERYKSFSFEHHIIYCPPRYSTHTPCPSKSHPLSSHTESLDPRLKKFRFKFTSPRGCSLKPKRSSCSSMVPVARFPASMKRRRFSRAFFSTPRPTPARQRRQLQLSTVRP
ncbi:hypothetical protein B0H12DRAFT_785006 [Mycena haematopus]|nr:hypothetical protein B0H12DRAFT_785006 [Mycena haematopus]